jgi:GNAT superfamily N-acetyltransferase
VNDQPDIEIRDVVDARTFAILPPCADPRFDHRSCDYWEDGVRGAKAARPSWWQDRPTAAPASPPQRPDNPFAPPSGDADDFNPFARSGGATSGALTDDDPFGLPDFNPFAPAPKVDPDAVRQGAPTKLRLLDRGRGVFGSYAKVLLWQGDAVVYAQFGPLSAYPRAQHIRELYPRLPAAPLPAVITCIATSPTARGHGLAQHLVETAVEDLALRGFAAIEAYPDLTLPADESAAAHPAFWARCGFDLRIDDERFPVMRRELV